MNESGGGFGSILKWGLIAGAAYFVYETFLAPAPAATPTATGSVTLDNLSAAAAATPAATTQVITSVPAAQSARRPSQGPRPGLAQKLEAAAKTDPAFQNNRMTAWQWKYYNASIQPESDASFGQAFYSTATDPITAEQYVAALQRVGAWSGLGGVTAMAPMLFQARNGRRVLVWASHGGDGTVKMFPAAHPFAFGRRGLPVA